MKNVVSINAMTYPYAPLDENSVHVSIEGRLDNLQLTEILYTAFSNVELLYDMTIIDLNMPTMNTYRTSINEEAIGACLKKLYETNYPGLLQ